jgi:hypothetical protein
VSQVTAVSASACAHVRTCARGEWVWRQRNRRAMVMDDLTWTRMNMDSDMDSDVDSDVDSDMDSDVDSDRTTEYMWYDGWPNKNGQNDV